MKPLCVTFVLGAAITAGCSGSGPKPPPLAKVSGTVTLDNQPMAGGEVRFATPGFPPRTIEVKDGAFSGEVYVGKNVVEVVWDKDAPNPMDAKGPPVKANVVSPKFSGPTSTLSADIDATGKSDLKFAVTSVRK